MSKNPINLALRFLLEIAAIAFLIIWRYNEFAGILRILMIILFPILFALIWGVFAVRDDPSRSGKTVVSTPGIIRLFIELILFGLSALAMYLSGYVSIALVFLTVVMLHYLISYDRIIWLLKN